MRGGLARILHSRGHETSPRVVGHGLTCPSTCLQTLMPAVNQIFLPRETRCLLLRGGAVNDRRAWRPTRQATPHRYVGRPRTWQKNLATKHRFDGGPGDRRHDTVAAGEAPVRHGVAAIPQPTSALVATDLDRNDRMFVLQATSGCSIYPQTSRQDF